VRITQVLVAAAPGDAVTTSALEIHRALDPERNSAICARYIDPSLAGVVRRLDQVDEDRHAPTKNDLLVVHVSIGEPDVAAWVGARPERLVICYHNISPAAAFEPYDPAFARLLRLGREELAGYRDRAVLALADSEFNAGELRAGGFRDVRVSPLVYDPARLTRLAPHPPTATHLLNAVRGPVVLFVGQLLPHKRPDYLVEAFYILSTHLLPEAHLIMVGAGRLPRYRHLLQTFIDELELTTVWLTGHVSDAELAAFYRRADAFATTSEHEGFCAPLLEAMSFDVPIVARAFGAVPDTLGDAGLLVGCHDGPAVFAEALAEVIDNRTSAADLVRRGHHQMARFDASQTRAAMVRQLEAVP
jgi:glycosyltransferase involved in cell wall biosynthesis